MFDFKYSLLIILLINSRDCSLINVSETVRNALNIILCTEEVNEAINCNVQEDILNSTKLSREIIIIGVTLTCRSNTFLSYRWPQNEPDEIYLIEVKELDNEWNYYNVTRINRTTVATLSEGTTYKIRVWIINNKRKTIDNIYKSNWTTTFAFDEVPNDLNDVNITRSIQNETNVVILSWTPSDDRPCMYEILSLNTDDIQILDVNVAETGSFATTLDLIDLDEYYTIFVMAKTERDENESNKTEVHLKPICSDVDTMKNHSMCKKPSTPEDLQAVTIRKRKNVYDVNVTWTTSNYTHLPDYYIAELIVELDYNNYTGIELNVSSDATSVTFSDVKLSKKYEVYVFGILDGVRSDPAIARNYVQQDIKRIVKNINQIWIILLPIVIVIGCVGLSLYFMIIKRTKKIKIDERMGKMTGDDNECGIDKDRQMERPLDKWEIDLARLSIGNLLGNGAFGIVKKGWLQKEDGNFEEVAVKTLNGNSTEEDKKQFLAEIDIMKSVGFHRHLVSFLGCNTIDYLPILIVEYCARGDLKTYLQNAWNILIDLNSKQSNGDDYENLTKDVSNKLYDVESSKIPTPVELVSFARQVSIAMEYLSSLHVLHRDLAARNVLICDDGIVKVSDFGLSRDVYRDNVYYKSTGGKLPIKWMAIESLTHQIYTSQSDVWSYGILLWEIVTLGANPYPGILTHELLTLLENDYRMEKPDGCSDQLYDIMRNCWLRNPKDRPTFTTIRNKLDYIMEDATQYLLLDTSLKANEINNGDDDDEDDESSSVNEKMSKEGCDVNNDRYVQP